MKDSKRLQIAKAYAPAVQNRLARFSAKEQVSLSNWLVEHPVGTNYALQILEYLEDLGKTLAITAPALLQKTLKSMEGGDQLHPKNLGRKVRDILYLRLHPQSQDHELKFEAFQQALALPVGTQLSAPANFEGSVFTLSLRFEKIEELKKQLETLQKSIQKGQWKGLEEF